MEKGKRRRLRSSETVWLDSKRKLAGRSFEAEWIFCEEHCLWRALLSVESVVLNR